jgi:hypothetical protein
MIFGNFREIFVQKLFLDISKQQKRKISAKTAPPGFEFFPTGILLIRKFGTEKINQVKR